MGKLAEQQQRTGGTAMTAQPVITREEAIRRADEHLAEGSLACQAMTPREQAEAAWTPTSRLSVDELEDLIRAERGYPPLDRSGRTPTDA